MNNVRRRLIGIAFLCLMLTLPVYAQTKQVIVNGDFEDTDISAWTVSFGTLSRTTTVVHTGIASGQLDLADTGESYSAEILQCIDLSGELPGWPQSGGKKYITTSAFFKSDDGSGSDAYLLVEFWTSIDCSTGYITGDFSTGVLNQDWAEDRITMEIPSTAQSIVVWAVADSLAPASVYVDDLQAFSSTPTMVAVQHVGVTEPRSMRFIVFIALVFIGTVVILKQQSLRYAASRFLTRKIGS